MKNLAAFFILSAVLSSFIANANTYYVSTTGNDSNPGTITQPFASLEYGVSVLRAGDTLYMRGGTYRTTHSASNYAHFIIQNLHGTSSNPIKIWAYPGEQPVFNLDNITVTVLSATMYINNCTFVHFKGLRATGLTPGYGWQFWNSNNLTIENCEADHSTEGFNNAGSSNLLFLNCDAHHLQNPPDYGGSNGFSSTGQGASVTNITFRGCRAWWCSDDGFDTFGSDGTYIYENCWSFWNGYIPGTFTPAGNGQGFKLGSTSTDQSATIKGYLTNCLAFQNRSMGFDQNNGQCQYVLYNNTAYNNGTTGYKFDYYTTTKTLKNNISYANGTDISSTPGWVQDHNSWNSFEVSSSDFLSLNSTGVDGPRQADGRLPSLNFLHLASTSRLIDAGVNIGLSLAEISVGLPHESIGLGLPFGSPIIGAAPDLGAFEYSNETINELPLVNQLPVANAGDDSNISLPTDSIRVTGSGTDAENSIISYKWKQVSGPVCTINNETQAQTVINNLTLGVYIFELEVIDNQNAIGRDSVQVTVNTMAIVAARYIKVNIYGGANPYGNNEWNNWNVNESTVSSVFNYTDGTASSVSARLSYGRYVADNSSEYGGTMSPPEVLRYASYTRRDRTLTISGLTTSQTYSIELYASKNSGQSNSTIFNIDQISDTVATYNNFTHAITFTNLTPNDNEEIIINISSLDTSDFNYLNGFMITENNSKVYLSSKALSSKETHEEIVQKPIEDNKAYLKVYPNPIKDNFILEVNNSYTGRMNVQIIDQSAAIRHTYSFNKDQQNSRLSLAAADLPSGVYYIRVQIGDWSNTRKLLKL